MINLESLNYLNQRKVSSDDLKNKLLNNSEAKVNKKDFKILLEKEKKGSRQIIEKPIDQKTIVTDNKEEKSLNINEEAVNKINKKVETLKTDKSIEKSETLDDSKISDSIEGEDTLELEDTLNEVLVALSSLFINENNNTSDLENLEELLIANFEELKTVVFESNNLSKEVNLLNIMTLTNNLEGVEPSEVITFKDALIEINDLLKEAVTINENIQIKGTSEDLVNQLKTIESDIKNEVSNLFNTLDSEEFKGTIKSINNDEKQSLLNTIRALVNNTRGKDHIKENSMPITESNIEMKTTIINSDLLKEDNFTNLESGYSEEDKVLSKVINNNVENKFNTVLNNSYDRFNNNINKVEQVPVYKETMQADIIKNVKYMVNNKVEELTVKIYPKELGELTIKLLSEEGIFKADIKATSKETYMLLNANIQDIKNTLSEQNIKIQEVNISIYNEDTTFFSGKDDKSNESEKEKSSINKIEGIEIEDELEDSLIDSNINILA